VDLPLAQARSEIFAQILESGCSIEQFEGSHSMAFELPLGMFLRQTKRRSSLSWRGMAARS
jgi:hypothetical protein